MSRLAFPRALGLLALAAPLASSGAQNSALDPSHGSVGQGGPAVFRTTPSLALFPQSLDFGDHLTGVPAPDGSLTLRNHGPATVSIDAIDLVGSGAGHFSLAHPTPTPFVLAPGAIEPLTIGFLPTADGGHEASVRVVHSGGAPARVRSALSGLGLGPVGAEILINAGGTTYVDGAVQTWTPDWGAAAGSSLFVPDAIALTDDDLLYQTARVGTVFGYPLPVPDGWYEVTLHFAETQESSGGARVFDVRLEGQPTVLGLDLFAIAGHDVAHSESHVVEVSDGYLNVDFFASSGEALISAIEVRATPVLAVTPASLDFEGLEEGEMDTLDLTLTNVGGLPLTIDGVNIAPFGGDSAEPFSLDFDGAILAGSPKTQNFTVAKTLAAGESFVVPTTFAPVSHDVFQAYVEFSGPDAAAAGTLLYGLAGSGHPFLHVVIAAPEVVVDYEVSGSADVLLDGTLSHTHEFGHSLIGFDWSDGVTPLGSGPVLEPSLPLGAHTLTLTITDDNVPAETLEGSVDVTVAPSTAVPGVFVRYYDASSTPASTLIDAVPANPDFVEVLETWGVLNDGTAGGSPFTSDVMVVMEADVDFDQSATWIVQPIGGNQQRLFIDGVPVTTPVFLLAGQHLVEARFAVTSLASLPLRVQKGIQGNGTSAIPAADTTHDQSGLAPHINSMPSLGSVLGGNTITIDGLGFFPDPSVTVHWGGTDFTELDFQSLSASRIVLTSPPASAGAISVTVETPNGTSPAVTYEYTEDGPVPIDFELVVGHFVNDPTTGAWGPDGRFYVASRLGQITAFEFDGDWDVTASQTYDGVSDDFPANEVLGIAFNPFDDPQGPVRLYVARSDLFAQNGGSFAGEAPYDGRVSILESPDFDTPIDLITGLPLSNHDHAVNGMEFDNNGDLYLAIGGNTNAGVQWPNIGDIPASPFSGAILKAETSKPGFNGAIVYVNENTWLPDGNTDDMVFGLEHAVQDGVDVHVHAPGLRNAYDIAYTTRRRLYATDNGPNFTFGPASTGPVTQDPDPQEPDELNLIEYGNYYGHPNHNRAEASGESRQYVYYAPAASAQPGGHVPPLIQLPSSSDGIVEYRSRSFGSQMRGYLLMQQWGNYLHFADLSFDGRSVVDSGELMWTGALDIATGPEGALLAMNYNGDNIKIYVPDDLSLVGLKVLDIHPWRAPAIGGATFVIGGSGFGDLGETSVTIGGRAATLSSVTPTRIVGTVPVEPSPTYELVDVVVTVDDGQGAPEVDTLGSGFYFLGPAGSEPGFWEQRTNMPVALGEVAAAEIGGLIYVFGEGSPDTYRYNTNTNVWPGTVARRDFVGHHHSVEVTGDKLYVIGGLGGGSEGLVQIYDPALDTWSLGASMPWSAGSVQTALIDGLIYAAGGIVGSTTVDNCAVYDPVLDQWTSLSPMPAGEGRNHAAAGTDGEKLWIFGGRGIGSGPCNCVANGFDTIHVYDPGTDTWESSLDLGSSLAPLPIGRGGTGKAIFHQGEFYVMGGETQNGPGATPQKVYARVDVYDPVTNTWRQDRDMPTPRHGIYPVVFQGHIYVAGGGVQAANSQSTTMDLLNHQ